MNLRIHEFATTDGPIFLVYPGWFPECGIGDMGIVAPSFIVYLPGSGTMAQLLHIHVAQAS